MPRRSIKCVYLAMLAAASAAGAQPCEPHWTDQYPSGLVGTVRAFTTFDPDGDGPEPPLIIAGGDITDASGVPASNIAAWDGFRWHPIGPGLNGTVLALADFDPDGNGPKARSLYAGGLFTMAGDLECAHMARWDGAAWHKVAGGTNGDVCALLAADLDGGGPDPAVLWAGGPFTKAGGVTVSNVARFDGTKWIATGTLEQRVLAFTSCDLDGDGPEKARVIAGGWFQSGDGSPLKSIGSWDGVAWQPLGVGFNGVVTALASWDIDGPGPAPSALYAGGDFTLSGGNAARRIARYLNGQWSEVDNGTDDAVLAMAVLDPDGEGGPEPGELIVGGEFHNVDNPPQKVHSAAAVTPSGWKPLPGGPLSFDPVFALRSGQTLYRGRPVAPGVYIGSKNYRWNAAVVDELGVCPLTHELYSGYALQALDIDGPGPLPERLYVGADALGLLEFGKFGGVGQFDGMEWAPLGDAGQLPGILTVYDDGHGPSLFIAGEFGLFKRWDGQQWHDLGLSMDVWDVAPWDPDGDGPTAPVLVASGWADIGTDLLLAWNGSQWAQFPSTQFFELEHPTLAAIAQYDPDGDGPEPPSFYLGGDFWKLNGEEFNNLARWDGNQWQKMGGTDQDIRDMVVFDEDGPGPEPAALFVTGQFTQIGGQPILAVARWDGSEWSQVGDGLLSGFAQRAEVLDPDGPGLIAPSLWVNGYFALADGTPSNLAAWDGALWKSMAVTSVGAASPAFFDDDGPGPSSPSLYLLGHFAGDDQMPPTKGLAVLECAVPICYPDLDADGSLTLFDFLAFINLFNIADPAADCDASGALDLFDFLCFVNAFNAGC